MSDIRAPPRLSCIANGDSHMPDSDDVSRNRTSLIRSVQDSMSYHTEYTLGCRIEGPTPVVPRAAVYAAAALSVRDELVKAAGDTEAAYTEADAKRVYYLSLEFLVGRSLQASVFNLGLEDEWSKAVQRYGYSLEEAAEEERDPALGNGGLGRLAACFMESLATLNYPARGYGIRYRYGMFLQKMRGGKQVEAPDCWLPSPWLTPRPHLRYPVRFYGQVARSGEGLKWEGGEVVHAVAYDMAVPGYRTRNTNCMRLWACEPSDEFDLGAFNAGRHVAAGEAGSRAEAISAVLYPSDESEEGKELRLKQEYFLVSATLQDILCEFKATGRPLLEFDTRAAIQLNDTHPTVAIPELMRLFLDEEHLDWDGSWSAVVATFGYTNHTILPEALERWAVPLVERVLPRIMEIIFEINHRHLKVVGERWVGSTAHLTRMSIIEESDPKRVRMAVLAVVGSHAVNGVAQIHSSLVKSRLFPDFVDMSPQKFQNKTNGVSLRRWLLVANPHLTKVISTWLKTEEWILKPELLQRLRSSADHPDLHLQWRVAKQSAKRQLAEYIWRACGVEVREEALFDVHVKRIHEYKRQLLNVLYCAHRYLGLKRMSPEERSRTVPRVSIFSGKAASSYAIAKSVIHLITAVGGCVNADCDTNHFFKMVFIPNYNVSSAQVIIPASDVSQHISTAGMEASGTSNMKFVLNGGLVVGTMDGANIEIAEAIGREKMFIFGALAEETESLRRGLPYRDPIVDERLQEVIWAIQAGRFGSPQDFEPLLNSIRPRNDYFLLAHDWPSYLDAQAAVDAQFLRPHEWTRRSILSTAMMGRFSSDRTIHEYARDIWNIQPVIARRR